MFEDTRLLAINKPSGIASHGGSGISFGVIEAMRALRPRDTLELIHRLDRDTSGLLVLSKKRSALSRLAIAAGRSWIRHRKALSTGRLSGNTTQAKSISAATAITFICVCTVIHAICAYPRPMTWLSRSQV